MTVNDRLDCGEGALGGSSAFCALARALRELESAAVSAKRRRLCDCDFCSGRKKWNDNWCAYCAAVKMTPPKWWENMDLCDACERLHHEDPTKFWGGELP